jgi:hydrogenase maturation protease
VNRRAQVLIAGIGNVFLSDDGFGSAVARRLQAAAGELPPGVEVIDVGIRGMHLAYQLLEGYHTLVLVDTAQRGGAPGSLYLLEHDLSQPSNPDPSALNAHGMDPASVLATLDELAAGNSLEERPIERALVLGCEPANLAEGLELSEPVAAAVDRAVPALIDLAHDLIRSNISEKEGNHDDAVVVRGAAGRGRGSDR